MTPTHTYTILAIAVIVSGTFPATAGGVIATSPPVTQAPSEPPVIRFHNQTSNGSAVTIRSVSLPDGGFVAVHDTGGDLLGVSSYLEPGNRSNVSVSLTPPIDPASRPDDGDDHRAGNGSSETILVAIAYRDTNGNRSFDYVESDGADDLPYVDDGVVHDEAVLTVVPVRTNSSTSETTG